MLIGIIAWCSLFIFFALLIGFLANKYTKKLAEMKNKIEKLHDEIRMSSNLDDFWMRSTCKMFDIKYTKNTIGEAVNIIAKDLKELLNFLKIERTNAESKFIFTKLKNKSKKDIEDEIME